MIALLACAAGVSDTGLGAVAVDGASYELAWLGALGETDEGWTVELSEVWVSDYSVALVPCPTARLSRVGQARAGHGEELDDSTLIGPWAGAFLSGELGSVDFEADWYCEVHVLSSGVGEDTLRLEGVARRGEVEVPLSVATGLAYGELVPLSVSGSGTYATVRIERDLGALFDGVDFATEEDLAWAVLGNLYAAQTVTVELEPHDHSHHALTLGETL